MRLLHTSDWHLGRTLKGKDRTPEIRYALDQVLEIAQTYKIDGLLAAGDIFETPNPTAIAEDTAYRFFVKLHELNIPAVVIAGNHDSASRLDGVGRLLRQLGVRVIGKPRLASQGGVVKIETAHGLLNVGALPFASERRLLNSENLLTGDRGTGKYKELMQQLMANLAQEGFTAKGVNVMMAHLTLDTATASNSEVPFYTRDTYSLAEGLIPGNAQYVALGHIHKPQQITRCSAPTYYSGSLIQVDFGEVSDTKSVNIIDVEPGSPAQVEIVPLTYQKSLQLIHTTQVELTQTLKEHAKYPGWLKFVVELDTHQPYLAQQVRDICPQALIVEPRYSGTAATTEIEQVDYRRFDPEASFRRYHQEQLATDPDERVVSAFADLYQELSHAPVEVDA